MILLEAKTVSIEDQQIRIALGTESHLGLELRVMQSDSSSGVVLKEIVNKFDEVVKVGLKLVVMQKIDDFVDDGKEEILVGFR